MHGILGLPLLGIGCLIGLTAATQSVQGQSAEATDLALCGQIELELGRDFENEDYVFGRVMSVQARPNGQFFVLDALELNVKVFDSRGQLLQTFGREGAGPGEFTHPYHMDVGEKTVAISDGMQRKWITFALDGKHLTTRRWPDVAMARAGYFLLELGDTAKILVVAVPAFSSDPRITDYFTTVAARYEGGRTDTIARIRTDAVSYRVVGPVAATGAASSGFGDGGAWALRDDTLLVTVNGYTGEVVWYRDAGRSFRASEKAVLRGRPQRVSTDDLSASKTRMLEERNRSWPNQPAKALILGEAPDLWSLASSVLIGDDGSAWIGVPIRERSQKRTWINVERSGVESRRCTLPADFMPTSFMMSRIYGYSSTDYDTPIVQVYRLN